MRSAPGRLLLVRIVRHLWIEEDRGGEVVVSCSPASTRIGDCDGCGVRLAKRQVRWSYPDASDVAAAADLVVDRGLNALATALRHAS